MKRLKSGMKIQTSCMKIPKTVRKQIMYKAVYNRDIKEFSQLIWLKLVHMFRPSDGLRLRVCRISACDDGWNYEIEAAIEDDSLIDKFSGKLSGVVKYNDYNVIPYESAKYDSVISYDKLLKGDPFSLYVHRVDKFTSSMSNIIYNEVMNIIKG